MSLIDTAREVRENAHAPYSKFKVGAAIRSASGAVYRADVVVTLATTDGTVERTTIAVLLPGSFDADYMSRT